MSDIIYSDLLLRGIEVPLEVFIVLVVITGGIYLIVFIADSVKVSRYESAKKEHIIQAEDIIYALGAAMVLADGKVKPEELAVAEAIGKKLYSNFKAKEFRRIVQEKDLIQNPKRLAWNASDVLNREGKEGMLIYLVHIAMSDGELHKAEKSMLSTVAKEWNLPEPDLESLLPEDQSIGVEDIIYALAASVITADGVVESSEVDAACEIGQKLFENFEQEELQAICKIPDQIPAAGKLASMIKDHLTDEGQSLIVHYLGAIASATEEENDEGWDSVETIAEIWGIEVSA